MVWSPPQSKQHVPGTPVLVKYGDEYQAAVVAQPKDVDKAHVKALEAAYKQVRGPLGVSSPRRTAASRLPTSTQASPVWGGDT
jgi:hypothetical protein